MGLRDRGSACGCAATPCFAGASVTRMPRPLEATRPGTALDARPPASGGYDLRGVSVLHTDKRLGEYKCDLNQGGKSSITLSDTTCLKSCTERHEKVHQADVSPCCQAAGTAYKAAEGDTAKQDKIVTDFTNWATKNRPYFECRGYQESVTCAKEKVAELEAKSKDSKKFTDADQECLNLARSRRDMWDGIRKNYCTGPDDAPHNLGGQYTACPWTATP